MSFCATLRSLIQWSTQNLFIDLGELPNMLNLFNIKQLFGATAGMVGMLALTIAPATAAITSYEGKDVGAVVGNLLPNTDIAAQQFDQAAATLGHLQRIDFEGLPQGSFGSRAVDANVTVAFGGNVENFYGIQPSWPGYAAGYNTTSGGQQYLSMDPFGLDPAASAYIDFTFNKPVVAFGTYLTGLGTAPGVLAVAFEDGSSHRLPVLGNVKGGAQFFGFTNPGKLIANLRFTLTPSLRNGRIEDSFGLDDVRYVTPIQRSVPEPTVILGLLMVTLWQVQARRSASSICGGRVPD